MAYDLKAIIVVHSNGCFMCWKQYEADRAAIISVNKHLQLFFFFLFWFYINSTPLNSSRFFLFTRSSNCLKLIKSEREGFSTK